jgi:signal transduction histidine kinase
MYRLLRAPFSRRAWRELAYVWVSLPLAVVGFVGVYATFSPVFPLVAITLWLARWWGHAFRGLAGRLLQIHLPPPALGLPPREPGPVAWVLAQLADRAGWRAALYILLRLPYAIVMVCLGAGLWLCAAVGIVAPVLTWLGGLPHVGVLMRQTTLSSWLVVPIGLVLLLVAPWVVHGLVRVDVYLMGRLLGRHSLRDRVRDLEQTRALAVDDAAATLRRIERDLHDGTQARLVALAMDLAMMRERLREQQPDLAATRALVDAAHEHAKAAIGELRDLAHGIHPPVLDSGLAEALQTLAAHSRVPVVLTVDLAARPAPAIETIAYFCVSELLANVARHSGAGQATVDVSDHDGAVLLRVSDDGVGGAGAAVNGGTGLAGLADRVRTVDGTLSVTSPAGGPTVVIVRLPRQAQGW